MRLDSARDRILEAVEKGQISAREAARLLDALAGRRQGSGRAVRLRVLDLASGRSEVDVLLPQAVLEAAAGLGVHLDALWGLGESIEAGVVLAALSEGVEGLLATAEDERSGRRLEVSAEPV